MTSEYSYPKHKINVLLLEKISSAARDKLSETGYSVREIPRALGEEELLEEIQDVHVLGIRSKTKVNAQHIAQAKKLLVLGCFGVGTNQVDLSAATKKGVPVFNAPYSSTRSVAELAIAKIFVLARQLGDKNNKLHQKYWDKSSAGAIEVRGKTLGLVGFGHIGQQVGVMAESLGMRVIFYDKVTRLPLGNSRQVESFEELLKTSDFVSLHLPALSSGKPLVGEKEISLMKTGSFLLNLSRGSLIDIAALRKALESKHLAGAALDVYPVEPKTNQEEFDSGLAEVGNMVLTPHIGGSNLLKPREILGLRWLVLSRSL